MPHTDQFITDLSDITKTLLSAGSSIDEEQFRKIISETEGKPVEETMMAIIPLIGLTGMDLPEDMAPLNTILNLLPADQRDDLLTIFFNM